jgi:hypothetical protein
LFIVSGITRRYRRSCQCCLKRWSSWCF